MEAWRGIGGLIPQSEQRVCELFSSETLYSNSPSLCQKVHKIFQKNRPLDFVLCEGTLKMDLLKMGGFSAVEIKFLEKSTKSFCQCAEFFMNAFKLGQTARSETGELFKGESYFRPVGHRVFEPCAKSVVYYPPLYKDLYSLEGKYAQVIKPLFDVSGHFDPVTQITTMTVGGKV